LGDLQTEVVEHGSIQFPYQTWCFAGPSPGFSIRGGQTPEEGAKSQKGGRTFKIQYWTYAAAGGPNVKWGAGHHCPPAGDGPGAL